YVGARGPVHLLHFNAHIVQEATQSLRIRRQFADRFEQRESADFLVCFFPIRSRCLCHQPSRLCPVKLASRPPALPAKELAGEEGFEPPLSVLETDGLPLNLLP